MVVKKKPVADAEDFIQGAIADKPTDKPEESEVKKEKSEARRKPKSESKSPEKNKTDIKRFTFYMPIDMYIKWEEYKLERLKSGNKTSFQGEVEGYFKKVLKM